MKETTFWIFRGPGFVTISRHARPDFVAGYSEEEVKKHYDRMKVKFPIGRFDTDNLKG